MPICKDGDEGPCRVLPGPMATEGGADLRERLIFAAVEEVGWEVDDGRDFDGAPRTAVVAYVHDAVDAILGAIAEAGMVIVDAEKMAVVIAQLASAERDRDSSGMVRAWKTIAEMLELDRTGGGA